MVVISKHGRYNVEKVGSSYVVIDSTTGLIVYEKSTYKEAEYWAKYANDLWK
jgi:hypothetical protein